MIRNTNETTTIADITVAMILGRPVTIDYENSDGVRRVRKVEPFEVIPPEQAVTKRPFFRAMDRLSGTYRSFRFDRLYAYRVSNARGRYKVPRPAPRIVPDLVESEIPTAAANGETSPEVLPSELDTGWGDWLESQYDPDAAPVGVPTAVPARSVDRVTGYDPAADEWAAWLEATYDPDAPVPYLPTPYLVPVDRLEDKEL